MNLDYCRKHDVQNRVLSYIINMGDRLFYNDQDALNFILINERKQLPCKYNFSPYHFHKLIVSFLNGNPKDINDARENPTIFHFCGTVKPWSLGSYLPGKELFIKYQKLSGWNYKIYQKHILKRIIYTLFPMLKRKMWENKTFIEGWEHYYE